MRITRDQKQTFAIDEKQFVEQSEKDLFAAIRQLEAKGPYQTLAQFLDAFEPIVPVINRFFESVMVMAEDPAVKANRLGLLQRLAALPAALADLSILEGF